MTIERESSSEFGTISSAKSRRKGRECVLSSSLLFHYKHLGGTNLKLRPEISALSTLGYSYSDFPRLPTGIPPVGL